MLQEIAIRTTTEEEHLLVSRILSGEHTKEDLASLRELMRQNPGKLSRQVDLCTLAVNGAIQIISRESDLLAELLWNLCRVMVTDLGAAEVLPVEKLLIDQIVMAWLRHYDIEARYTAIHDGDCTIAQAKYWEQRLSASQRRYLRAIETHARVGKLLRSVSLQVNIGEKQVNVAG